MDNLITFNGLVAIEQSASNNRLFYTSTGGYLQFGGAARELKLSRSTGGEALWSSTAGAIRGTNTCVITVRNNSGVQSYGRAWWHVSGPQLNFFATIVLSDYTGLAVSTAPSGGALGLTECNVTVNGVGCALWGYENTVFGASDKTLTINNNVSLGDASGSNFFIAYVVSLGSTKRTLTVNSYTEFDSNVTGTNGFIKAGTQSLFVQASSTLSGQIVIDNGALALGTYNSTGPNVLPSLTDGFDFSATASAAFLRYYGNSAFTENRPMTVSGTPSLCHLSAQLNNTITFGPASLISSYPGIIQLVGDETITAPAMSFGTNVPATAAAFQGHTYNTTAGNRTYRFTLAPTSPVTLQGYIDLWSSNSISGHTLDIQNNGTADTTFANPIAVQKRAGASGASSSQAVTFSGSSPATTTLQGNILQDASQGTLSLSKSFPGRLVLQGTNALTGSITVSAGILEVQNYLGLGPTTSLAITTSGTGQIFLTGSTAYLKNNTSFIIHALNPIVSVGDNILVSLGITLAGTPAFTVEAGNKLTLQPGNDGISGAFGITKNGDGELRIATSRGSYTGDVTLNAGTLSLSSVANGGVDAAWGRGTTAVVVKGTLKYTGGTSQTTRTVLLSASSPTLDASGSGAVTFLSVSLDNGSKTITLQGSNTGPNTIGSALPDQGGTTALVKDGSGKWVLNNSLSYSGTTTVSAGTLRVETASSNASLSSAVAIASGATVECITTSTPPESSASSGKVLGEGNVVVTSGTIKTGNNSTSQKGQMRYGGNLTFTGNSYLYIGGAAAA
jgi:autotransporter-associated beta strand protein